MAEPAPHETRCVGILSPGEMGHAVGRTLSQHGLDVATCLAGRSDRTRELARRAAIRDVSTIERLVTEVDLLLCILVPAQARAAAEQAAQALRATGRSITYADCNAVAPASVQDIGQLITKAGSRFVDASIIGFPPGLAEAPRFYVSGPHAEILDVLDGKGVEIISAGDQIGQASAIKMCYAGLTKGTFALQYAISLAAERMGMLDALARELQYSQSETFQKMQRQLPRLPAKAHRWIGEMEEIADAFSASGVSPLFHRAAAEIYRAIQGSPLGAETPETIDPNRTWNETIRLIADSLPHEGWEER